MATTTSSKGGSDVATLIFPATAVALVYAVTIFTLSVPGAEEVKRLEGELNGLQGSRTTWQQVEVLRNEASSLTENVDALRQNLGATQAQAQTFCGEEIAPVDQLQTLGSVDGVLQQSGLVITADRNLRQRGRMQLAATLKSATDNLLDEIHASQQIEQERGTPYLPPNLPPDISPEEFLAGRSAARRGRTPEMQYREVEAIGSYHAMVSALDELNRQCDNSLVIGLAVRRPEPLTDAHNLRLWTLQLQVRPSPTEMEPASPSKPDSAPPQLAADGGPAGQ